MRGFPGQTPNPSYTSDAPVTTPTVAAGAGTVAATLPAIKGGDVTKKLDATISIVGGVGEVIFLTAERDGTPFGESYGVTVDASGAIFNVSCTWLDETPGKGEPVYIVRCTGSVGGASVLSTRRATVHNV